MDITKEFSWRGTLQQATNEEKLNLKNLNKGVYCGFYPTGDSLHVGFNSNNFIRNISLFKF